MYCDEPKAGAKEFWSKAEDAAVARGASKIQNFPGTKLVLPVPPLLMGTTPASEIVGVVPPLEASGLDVLTLVTALLAFAQGPMIAVSRPPAPTWTQFPLLTASSVSVIEGTLTTLAPVLPECVKVSVLGPFVPLPMTSWRLQASVAEADADAFQYRPFRLNVGELCDAPLVAAVGFTMIMFPEVSTDAFSVPLLR